MKKKIFTLLLIAILFITSVITWSVYRWGIKPNNFIKYFKYLYLRDQYLKIGIIVEGILYLLICFIIFKRKPSNNTNSGIIKKGTTEQPLNNQTNYSNLYKQKNSSSNISFNNLYNSAILKEQRQKRDILNTAKQQEITNNIDIYKKQINTTIAKYGYETMQSFFVKGVKIDFTAIAEHNLLIIGTIDTTQGDITINEDIDKTQNVPLWTVNNNTFTSPIYKLQQAITEIKNVIDEVLPNGNNIQIYPIIIFPEANITNYNEVKEYLNLSKTYIASLINDPDIPNISDIIPNKTEVAVLESYKKFIQTLIQYFSKTTK